VALTVTFTVCDAQQIGLSPSAGVLWGDPGVALARSVRPEQKATPTLAPFRAPIEVFASRKQPSENGRSFGQGGFRYVLKARSDGLRSLCFLSRLGQTTRGPPLMDPPLSC
jgi:hypothetical protein